MITDYYYSKLFIHVYTLNLKIGTNDSVHLRGGGVPNEGTVEYCINGTWKAICDNFWNNKNSFVVCRQLGFPATSNYGSQEAQIHLIHPMNVKHVGCQA